MGVSNSKNVADIMTSALTKVSTNIIQTKAASADQTIFQKGKCINAKNSTITNRIGQINVGGLMEALQSGEYNTKLENEVRQAAKALTKDIAIGEVSNAENLVNSMVSTTTDIAAGISQGCNISTNQTIHQETEECITLDNTSVENVLDNLFLDCVQNTVMNNKTLTEAQQKLDQVAIAETIGTSIWGFVALGIIAILFVLAPALVPLVFGSGLIVKNGLRIVFPSMVIFGIISSVVYLFWKKEDMRLYGYSNGTGTRSKIMPGPSMGSINEASLACLSNKKCKAVDFIDGKTKYYSSIESKNPTTGNNPNNWTAYKVEVHRPIFLTIGIIMFLIGIFGSVVNRIKK